MSRGWSEAAQPARRVLWLGLALATMTLWVAGTGAVAQEASGAESADRVERWMCPACPHTLIDWSPGSATLQCPECGGAWDRIDLTPPVGYLNIRTRDTEIAWVLDSPDCGIYRYEGLQVFDDQRRPFWIPWSRVEWCIPRMRLVRTTDGQEFATDYAKGSTCPEPPRFVSETADSTCFLDAPCRPIVERREDSLAEVFLVAFTPEARDLARARFIEEVEAGKHPRLPRTLPKMYREGKVMPTGESVQDTTRREVLFDIRVHEARGIVRARIIESSGDPQLDQAALRALRASQFGSAGELGVPVPSWMQVRVIFHGEKSGIEPLTSTARLWQ